MNLRYGQPGEGAAFYSAGLHPWFLREENFASACDWLADQAGRSDVLAIGEAGLDKVTDTPWPLQMAAFQRCVEISETVRKPLIIHCVRAFSEIMALKKQWKTAQPWVFHGFDKNLQTAEMLLKAGCYLSYGAALFLPKHPAAASLQSTASDRFFLETDDSDTGIEDIYQKAAGLRGISLLDMSQYLEENFRHVFKM